MSMNGLDTKAAIAKAKRELQEEAMEKAVAQLKEKYKELSTAQAVVRNVEREIADLEADLADGAG